MTEFIKIPPYEGTESANEDIVYSYFRRILNQQGYSLKVKRTGFPEIDNLILLTLQAHMVRVYAMAILSHFIIINHFVVLSSWN